MTELSMLTFNSVGIPPSRRLDYWSNFVTEFVGGIRIDAFGANTLDGNIEISRLGRVQMSHIEFTRHRVTLPSSYPRRFSGLDVIFQTEGTLIFQQDDRQIVIEPGDCLAFDNSRPFVIKSERLSKIEHVTIPSEVLRQRGVPCGTLLARRLSDNSTARLAYNLMKVAQKEAETLPSEVADSVTGTLVDFLLLPFSQELSPPTGLRGSDSLRWRAKAYINDRLDDPNLSINTIANALGCTKRYLHMLFGKEGMTIERFIWQSRIERCRADLESPQDEDRSITDIAFKWGFSSSSHFSRVFKRQFGVSPSAVRRRSLSS